MGGFLGQRISPGCAGLRRAGMCYLGYANRHSVSDRTGPRLPSMVPGGPIAPGTAFLGWQRRSLRALHQWTRVRIRKSSTKIGLKDPASACTSLIGGDKLGIQPRIAGSFGCAGGWRDAPLEEILDAGSRPPASTQGSNLTARSAPSVPSAMAAVHLAANSCMSSTEGGKCRSDLSFQQS